MTISARKMENRVCILISNTGSPIDLEHVNRLLQDASPSVHVGLRNVQQRIQLAFGQRYGIQLTESEQLETLVKITIPYGLSPSNPLFEEA